MNTLNRSETKKKVGKMKKEPTHFAVEDIKFYAMNEDNEIITNKKNEEILYRFKKGIRFKPLEYFCEDITQEILEEIKA